MSQPHDPRQGNVGNGNLNVGRDYRPDQRAYHRTIDNRGGRYAGRDYVEQRNRAYYEGDQYHVDTGQDMGIGRGNGKGIGRLIAFLGLCVALAGFGAFTLVIFGAMAGDVSAADPMSRTVAGVPLLPLGFAAVLAGGLIAGAGRSMAKSAQRRHEQRQRDRRRREFYR